ncbi:DnaJ domain protein [Aspergillus undulatus]|uniref:DnaJ domain protein n=1 Tax=Aspergillus undulatus TaxID=1810928 RepID=UPI003CCDCA37
MVKLDVRRDYYADLGLTHSADAEDIKKQFRKLALKYHPDRNPGREVESNAKFQAIQAAHEILIDPHQRLKYDTDRLRNGYYGSPKPTPRRDPMTSHGAARPNTKATFSERPKSFHHGPSTGAQRYASYARAAPKQPWEKMRDETQTRADAYRGFQEMKGNAMPGWSSFDPRGARSGQPGAVPRPTGTTNGSSTRPKSAFEHVYTDSKTNPAGFSARAQAQKKKQGFAPRDAGGDEPMAANTASYRSAPRTAEDIGWGVPAPTARKPAAGFTTNTENRGTPEYERTRSTYATTGGEKTFFSSSMLGRSGSARTSPKNKNTNSRPRTNPPSPDPQQNGRHRSASPSMRGDKTKNYDSTSSSDLSEDEHMFKPKAVPKSRLRQQQKFANFHSSNGWFGPAHDSDSASSARNNSDTPVFSKKADFAFVPKGSPQNPTFKSSSHDDLRKSSRREPFGDSSSPHNRGRASTRDSSQGATGNTASRNASGPESASQQTPFSGENFLKNDWTATFQFKNLSDALPTNDGAPRQPNSQRTRSPRKQARPTNRMRPTPQQASVATEAEEAESAVDGGSGQAPDVDGAMDIDDGSPARPAGAKTSPPRPNSSKEKTTPTASKSRPTSGSKDKDAANLNPLNMKGLSGVFPFTSTNSDGLDDLKDISSTLPFESRPKAPKTTKNDTHPRNLSLPNPPKRPETPKVVLDSMDFKQVAVPRAVLDQYIAEMTTYVSEWEAFDGRMLGHFLSRHRSNSTEMAPNWLGGIGDSVRLGGGERGKDLDSGDESDDNLVPPSTGTAKRGFTSYKNALLQDEKVMKHWEVAREMHLECMVKFGEMRDWVRNGAKIV